LQDISLQNPVAHSLAKYRNHLEFNGYKIEEEEDLLFGRHLRKANLVLKKIEDRGILINIQYDVKENVKRINLLEFINSLNTEFLFVKAYIDDESLMHIETFLEGEYDRTNFSIILDNIEFDMNILFQNELTETYIE
jgi:hypothetical protein